MSTNGYPSMTALLGLLAVAGYQHREKISEWLGGANRDGRAPVVPPAARTAAVSGSMMPSNLDRILGGVGSAGVGGLIASGLSELVEHFTKGGHGEAATSWVGQGTNRTIAEADLERAIGPATLDRLVEQTGLARSEIVSRLSRELPSAVDRYATEDRRVL